MDKFDGGLEPLRPEYLLAIGQFALRPPLAGPYGGRPEAVNALQSHPHFAAASKAAAAGLVGLYQGNRLLNTMVNDRGRLLISLFAVHLHLLSRPNDPHSGLTVSRMMALCTEQKICSPGRAKAMLMLMRVFGYLAPAPDEADRRLRRLVPTERLISLHRERIRRHFEAIVTVFPDCADAFSAQSDPGFMPLYICRYAEQFLAGYRYIDRVPDMRLFIECNAGIVILCTLLLSGDEDDAFPPARPVSVSLSAISRHFGVSRAHVRRLLQDAVNQALLERTGGDRFRVLPRLAKAVNDLMAEYFLLVAHCAQVAFNDFGQANLLLGKKLSSHGLSDAGVARSSGSSREPKNAQDSRPIGLPLFESNLPSEAATAAVIGHVRFPEASRIVAAGLVALYQRDRIVNLVMPDRVRYIISLFAVHLHFTGHPNDPNSGLTAGRLRKLCVERKVCSAGRAEAMLAIMRTFGHLVPAPGDADRQLRRLVPAEPLFAWHRKRCTHFLDGAAKVMPEHANALAGLRSPEFMPKFMRHLAQSHVAGFHYVAHVPDIRLFYERSAGGGILMSLMLSGAGDDTFPPSRPVSVSTSVVARDFGVSRVHVRRLLQDAVGAGLLERVGSNDAFRVLPRLSDATRRVLATYIVHYTHCARLACADFGQGSAAA